MSINFSAVSATNYLENVNRLLKCLREKNIPEAVEVSDHLLNDPRFSSERHASLHQIRAMHFYNETKYDEALLEAEKGLSISTAPADIKALLCCEKAKAHLSKSEYSSAFETIEKGHTFAITSKADRAKLYFYSATCFLAMGKFDQAIGEADKALAISPLFGNKIAQLYHLKASAHYRKMEYAEMFHNAQLGLVDQDADSKTQFHLYFYLAIGFLKRDQPQKAQEIVETYCKDIPKESDRSKIEKLKIEIQSAMHKRKWEETQMPPPIERAKTI